jgi:hypothetical protein
MTAIFGKQDINEKKIIRCTMVIYCVVFAIRIFSLVVIISDKQYILIHFYSVHYLQFELILSSLWAITDLIPVVYLFKVHYNNFMSFEGQSIIETEYDAS